MTVCTHSGTTKKADDSRFQQDSFIVTNRFTLFLVCPARLSGIIISSNK